MNRPSPTRLGRAWAVLVATVVLTLLVGACGGMPPSGDAPPSGEGSEPSGTLLPNDPTPEPTPIPDPQHEVYGFVPYWEMDADIVDHVKRTDLTTLALFSVTHRRSGAS